MVGTLDEDQCTFLIISRSVFLRMKNVADKSCRETRNIHFMFNNFSFENLAFYEVKWKELHSWAGHR